MPTKADVAAAARALMRRAFKGSLATIQGGSGYPYGSLITLATDPAGAPIFLISKLARHTANLIQDSRASVMVLPVSALIVLAEADRQLRTTLLTLLIVFLVSDDAAFVNGAAINIGGGISMH